MAYGPIVYTPITGFRRHFIKHVVSTGALCNDHSCYETYTYVSYGIGLFPFVGCRVTMPQMTCAIPENGFRRRTKPILIRQWSFPLCGTRVHNLPPSVYVRPSRGQIDFGGQNANAIFTVSSYPIASRPLVENVHRPPDLIIQYSINLFMDGLGQEKNHLCPPNSRRSSWEKCPLTRTRTDERSRTTERRNRCNKKNEKIHATGGVF